MNKLDEFKYNVDGKNITVIGIGISNLPLIKYLVSLGANVTACDRRSAEDLGENYTELEKLGVKFNLGDGYLNNLSGDMIFKTPGMRYDVPELLKAKEILGDTDFTSQDLADILHITLRSANRMLDSMVRYHMAALLYHRQKGTKGRPQKVYRIIHE